ncbi:ADP-glyceromanno-heptose 6-epimerase [Brevifollis gellanilyticus]|uniref:ADP-L-glycero-D-manno-heptose-6-epimerase n=1 Tax=Brevifollis gellanilyticus TaxID=748831 RepID=A0A512MGW8_9BACT|nr:ADP-glyceromanno-heptose 6-epimerase [Brevifollis gellanilyticus]GEP45591.1 ADP-L-glycero-D-manno-heptose-6-epimerase [Brevifollis gellanilyticus]
MLKSSESRILVTGGAGFIGSALVWELNRRGFENVIISDKLCSDEKWRNLVPLKFHDYIDGTDLEQQARSNPDSLGKFDVIFHLGACSATTEKNAEYLMRNNYEFTKVLAEWSVAKGTRFVYASSAATYGDGSLGMDDELEDLHRLRPLNMYGYSKHLFDLHAKRTGMDRRIVGMKYFNVYGPNEDHKADMRSVVHKAYGQILNTGKVQLFKSDRPDYKDGEQMRDFLYVKDAIKMTLHLATEPLASGLYNLGSGEAHTWVQLVTGIFAALGKEPVIDFVPMPEHLKAKYQYYTCADIARLRKSGYAEPLFTLNDAVKDYVQGYLVGDKRLGDEAL